MSLENIVSVTIDAFSLSIIVVGWICIWGIWSWL